MPVDLLSDGPVDGPWRVSAYDLKEWNNEFDYTAGVAHADGCRRRFGARQLLRLGHAAAVSPSERAACHRALDILPAFTRRI